MSADDPDRCGARSPSFKVTCDRLKGHTANGDWHEGTATSETVQRAADYEFGALLRETARWSPAFFETPKPEMPDGS